MCWKHDFSMRWWGAPILLAYFYILFFSFLVVHHSMSFSRLFAFYTKLAGIFGLPSDNSNTNRFVLWNVSLTYCKIESISEKTNLRIKRWLNEMNISTMLTFYLLFLSCDTRRLWDKSPHKLKDTHSDRWWDQQNIKSSFVQHIIHWIIFHLPTHESPKNSVNITTCTPKHTHQHIHMPIKTVNDLQRFYRIFFIIS